MPRPALAALALATLAALSPAPAAAQGAIELQLGLREAEGLREVELYARRVTEAGLGPARVVWGASVTDRGAVWAGVGLVAAVTLGGGWAADASVMPGLRIEGSGADLGHPVQVRSALAVSRALGPGRLALGVDHLSNAWLRSRNPGSDSVFLRWTLAR